MKIRLVNEPLNIYLDEIELKYNILVIESKTLLFQIIKDLYNQSNNEYGDFVLSEDDKQLDIKENFELILDPFKLDINNRKVLTAIQKLAILESINEIHYIETNKIISQLVAYSQKIAFTFNGNITTKNEITNESIIKMLNFQVDTISESFTETLLEYLLNSNKYLNTKVFCFVNLFSYIENEQIDELIHSCLNNNIHVIFLESSDNKYFNNECKKIIIDCDFCQI
ncbi:MAG: type II-A CRISPR-associated protein Csn2 [Pleomorphochaeta sp.]